uniref:Uncharacterized protein n=1 Tax=Knipowitschia caucasica TaxID=637954 RepID=A0AAV2MLH0_KNICA
MGLNGDLYFSHVSSRDSQTDYSCNARFLFTIQQKNPYHLKVLSSRSVPESTPSFLSPSGSESVRSVLRDQQLLLECIAAGRPTPTISWFKKGGDLPDQKVALENFNKTLRVSSVSEEDAGEYICLATNRQGSIRHTTSVSVRAAPYWLDKPTNLVLAPDENGRLVCRANGNPKPHIEWLVNGQPLNSSLPSQGRQLLGDTILFRSVQIGSSAVYQCNASNPHGSLLANAFVNVLDMSPRMLAPKNQLIKVIENNRTFLDCPFFGSPLPELRWFKNGQGSGLDGGHYRVHRNGTLEIKRTRPEDEGTYTCVANSILGTAENQVRLEVKEPTRIVRAPEHQSVVRGSTVRFDCRVKTDPSLSLTVTWTKDHTPLHLGWRFRKDEDSLTISKVDESDEGTYTCTAQTSIDQDSASGRLTVLEHHSLLPSQSTLLPQEPPEPPSDLELSDLAARSVRLTWIPGQDHQSPVTGTSNTQVPATHRYQQRTGPSEDSHRGDQEETQDTEGGDQEETQYTEGGDQEETQDTEGGDQEETQDTEGGDKEETQDTEGGDQEETQYTEGGDQEETQDTEGGDQEETQDTEGVDQEETQDTEEETQDTEGGDQEETQLTEGGDQEETQDTEGGDKEETQYTEGGDQEETQYTEGGDQEETQLTEGGDQEETQDTEGFLVQFEEDRYEPGVWRNLSSYPGDHNSVILQLAPFINYCFRVIAINAIGPSLPSRPSSRYKTSGAAPDAIPRGLRGWGSSKDNMEISWEPLSDLERNGLDLQYQVWWKRSDSKEDWKNVTTAASKHVVRNTPTFVPFDLKIRAQNNYGPGPESNTVIGYSGEDVPEAPPTDLRVSRVDSTKAQLQWTPVNMSSVRGHFQEYRLYYWRDSSLVPGLEVPKVKQSKGFYSVSPEPSVVVTDLVPFSNYTMFMVVTNTQHQSQPSNTVSFSTKEGVPDAPSFFRINRKGLDSLHLEWDKPLEPNGILIGYQLKYTPVNASRGVRPLVETFPPNVTHFLLRLPDRSTRYKLFLSARTQVGSGEVIAEEAPPFTNQETLGPSLGMSCAVMLCQSHVQYCAVMLCQSHVQYCAVMLCQSHVQYYAVMLCQSHVQYCAVMLCQSHVQYCAVMLCQSLVQYCAVMLCQSHVQYCAVMLCQSLVQYCAVMLWQSHVQYCAVMLCQSHVQYCAVMLCQSLVQYCAVMLWQSHVQYCAVMLCQSLVQYCAVMLWQSHVQYCAVMLWQSHVQYCAVMLCQSLVQYCAVMLWQSHVQYCAVMLCQSLVQYCAVMLWQSHVQYCAVMLCQSHVQYYAVMLCQSHVQYCVAV